MELQGRVALVTGAGRGIGAAIADVLAGRGAGVAVADVNKDAAGSTAQQLDASGNEALAVEVDVSDEKSVAAMVDTVIKRFGKIDILVNNAGVGNFSALPEVEEADWDRVVGINLKGVQLCSRAVLPHMQTAGYGKIVNLASMGGQVGGLKVAPDYVASKAGVIGLTKSYARYGAQYGILANAVSPGPTESEMAGDHFDPSTMPLKRLGKPQDIAWAVFFLSSFMSDYITGATIDVNGGMLMR